MAVGGLFCVYVCLWSRTFQPSLCNLLCLAAQLLWSWGRHMNPTGRGHQVSFSLRLNPAPPSSGRLRPWSCGGSVCLWAEPSTGGQGALGLPQELLSLSQPEQATAPCHKKTQRGCHLLNSAQHIMHGYHQEGGKTPISVLAGKKEPE